jgi:ubiquinol-cytochrome c reductase cytochrome b subunit
MAGGVPPEGTWLIAARLGTTYYFLYFVVLLPLVGRFETPLPLLGSISRSVPQCTGNYSRAGLE